MIVFVPSVIVSRNARFGVPPTARDNVPTTDSRIQTRWPGTVSANGVFAATPAAVYVVSVANP